MNWKVKKFLELSIQEVYNILRLRAAIFVVEQNCVYQDLDGKDENSIHVFASDSENIVAYARIVLPGISYQEISIGRVVVAEGYRYQKLGFNVMKKAMNIIELEMGKQPIRISAQSHLEKFYRSLDFKPTGKSYLEDGIPHIEMLRL